MRTPLFSLTAGVSLATLAPSFVHASDHLDTPTVAADARADIGDIYAWMAADGRHLNLVMTIVGHSFPDQLGYTFHIDSGKAFGATSASVEVTCRFSASYVARCAVGEERAGGKVDAAEALRRRVGV